MLKVENKRLIGRKKKWRTVKKPSEMNRKKLENRYQFAKVLRNPKIRLTA